MPSSLLDAALAHHVAGNVVIAVTQDKKPYRDGWNEYFTRKQTEAEVREYFSNGAYGAAMVLWPASKYAALDFDGVHADEAWQTTNIDLPETALTHTRSGGKHLYFRMPADAPELKRKVRIVKASCDCAKSCGVDLLIHGYAIIPPTPGYKEDPDHPLEDAVILPGEILSLAAEKPSNESRRTGDATGRVGAGERNVTACSLAGSMRSRGMSIEAIRAALKADNEQRFDPPLDDSEIEGILKQAEKWEPGKTGTDEKPQRAPVLVCINDVVREDVKWLWANRIPLGKLTIIQGDPGLGKSQITLALAASVSRGLPIHGDTIGRDPANVLILSAEDGLADTIRPRLENMAGDLSRVHAITALRDEQGQERSITLNDVDILEAAIGQHKPLLVIVDPLIAYVGKTDTHKAGEVRGILAPLAALAERHGCAVVAVQHLNKSTGKAIYRGQGSIDFLAACRSMFLVGKNPDDPTEKIMCHLKSNLGPEMPSLSFSIEDGRFVWGKESTISADDILAAPVNSDDKSQVDAAADFLRDTLEGGWMATEKIVKTARGAGIAERTLWRAKNKAGVIAKKLGFSGQWGWELPPKSANGDNLAEIEVCQEAAKSASPASVTDVAALAESWQPSARKYL